MPNAPDAVSYHEALLHLMAVPLEPGLRSAAEHSLPPPPSLFARLCCLAPPALPPLLREQQLRLLALARVPLGDADPMHAKLLESLYAVYTGGWGTLAWACTGLHAG